MNTANTLKLASIGFALSIALLRCNDANDFKSYFGNNYQGQNRSELRINFTTAWGRANDFRSTQTMNPMTGVYVREFWNLGGNQHYRGYDKIGLEFLDDGYEIADKGRIKEPELRPYAKFGIDVLVKGSIFKRNTCALQLIGDCALVFTLIPPEDVEPIEIWARTGNLEFANYSDSRGNRIIIANIKARSGTQLSIHGRIELEIDPEKKM